MVKQTGTDETVMRSSSTRPKSCANCAKQVCLSPRFFGNSPRTGIAIWSWKKSLDALCLVQSESNHQILPAAGPNGYWNNWGQCFRGCTQLAGLGGIASRRIFLFGAEQCGLSISRAHAGLIKPSYCHGVRQTIPRHRIVDISPDVPEHSRMITRWG